MLTVSTNSTVAPAVVTFDGSQSTAADGTVEFYYWDFGDYTGDTSGSLKTATKTYTVAGAYTVSLTVVDNKGFSSTTSQTISAVAATPVKAVSIRDFNISLSVTRTGSAKARGAIVVVNQLGQVMRGAVVSAVWSGVVSKTSTLRSSRFGKTTFTSPPTKIAGCYNLTITGISLAGYTVDQGSLRTTRRFAGEQDCEPRQAGAAQVLCRCGVQRLRIAAQLRRISGWPDVQDISGCQRGTQPVGAVHRHWPFAEQPFHAFIRGVSRGEQRRTGNGVDVLKPPAEAAALRQACRQR